MANKVHAVDEKIFFDLIGSLGPWQWRVFIVVSIATIIGMFHSFAITFLAPNMDYWCVTNASQYIQNRTSWSNSTRHTLQSVSSNSTNQCEVQFIAENDYSLDSEDNLFSVPCTDWKYNTSYDSQTIISEWDLVCDREWMISFAKSIYMLGYLASMFITGQISDCIGRFPTIAICYTIAAVSGLVSILSNSYPMFVAGRFFLAFGRTGLTATGYVLLMEIVGPEHRTKLGTAYQFSWPISIMILPWIAWFVRNWFWLQVIIIVPIFPLICIFWIMPESPRWLMTQRKKEKFLQAMTHAAKVNRKEISHEICESQFFPKAKNEDVIGKTRKSIFDLVRTSQIRKRSLIMAFSWSVSAFVYYATGYNTNDLGGDPYMNVFLSGVMEFLALAFLFLTINKFRRKVLLISGMMAAGAMSIALMAVPPTLYWLVLTLSMISKFFICEAFSLLYIYTMEMFPTVVRNNALGFCSTCARITASIAPFYRELATSSHYTVPNAILSALTITAGLLGFLLPETKSQNMPDTIEEGEHLGTAGQQKNSPNGSKETSLR